MIPSFRVTKTIQMFDIRGMIFSLQWDVLI